MKRILTPQLAEILINRVEISRQIKLFTIEKVSEEWNVPIATLYRYISPELRVKSRLSAKVTYDRIQKIDKTLCQICPLSLKGHPRCPICTQLTHDYSIHTHPLH